MVCGATLVKRNIDALPTRVFMIPIRELLNRIRWDTEFARGDFELGYFDRVENCILVVPFDQVGFPKDAPQAFQVVSAEGEVHRVPFHRVREVYKDGQRIWWRRGRREKE
jgi:uncharacterized protein (UPF0248 family)